MVTAGRERPEPGERGSRTRRSILDAALRLFGEQGYDRTTMRAIAAAAGVSLGNAYYYFPSKDHLVQEFYARIQDEHRRRVAGALAAGGDLADRLRLVLRAGIDVMTPYHEFAGSFIKVAIEPGAAASPFSPQSAPARQASIALFRELVDGAAVSLDEQVRAELPELLWLGYLAITLYWVHDSSPGQLRTRSLIDRVTPQVARLVTLSRLPVLRGLTADVLTLARELRP